MISWRRHRRALARFAIGFIVGALTLGWFSSTLPRYLVADSALSTDAQLVELAKEACTHALGHGECSNYEITLVPTLTEGGRVPIGWKRDSDHPSGRPIITEVQLNPQLVPLGGRAAQFTAAHEWNHVEQANVARSVDGREAMTDRALALFGPRMTAPLARKDALEVLADCMTLADGFPPPSAGPWYLSKLAQGRPYATVCQGWSTAIGR